MFRKLFVYLILPAMLGGIIGLVLVNLYHWYTDDYSMPTKYRELRENPVFDVTRKQSELNTSWYDALDIVTDISNTKPDTVTIGILKSKLANAKETIKNSQVAFDEALNKVSAVYGGNVAQAVQQYISWQKQSSIDKVLSGDRMGYIKRSMAGDKKTQAIMDALVEASGVDDLSDPESAYIMSLVPEANKALAKSSNDKTLCTVMRKTDLKDMMQNKVRDAGKIAAIIAFLDNSWKYCSDYYHQPTTWGLHTPDEINGTSSEATGAWAALPYNTYYEKHVRPHISEAEKNLSKEAPYSSACATKGIVNGERNPTLDAFRMAYRANGEKMCTAISPGEKNSFIHSSFFCLIVQSYFGEVSLRDRFERCKSQNGLLFELDASQAA